MRKTSSHQRNKMKVALGVVIVGLVVSALVAGMLYLIGQTRPKF